jgi:3D (Asp-Asp-Asp) domain-containing protein
MKKWQQVSAIMIISTYLLSNIALADQYKVDTAKLEKKIDSQKELIKQYKIEIKTNKQLINQKVNELNSKNNVINDLNSQLDQVKKENDDLKKQLAQRKEVTNKQRTLTIEASAYTANCKGCSGKTAIGYNVNNTTEYNGYRIIATDPSVIPLYSVVKIETEYNTFKAVAIDTGGAIKGNKIDLLVNTYSEAIQFGRQDVTVTILD